jgi:hypothetical protein
MGGGNAVRRWVGTVLFVGLMAGAATAQMQEKKRFSELPVNPADYKVNVHVTHAFLAGVLATLHLDVLVDGKKLQLEGQSAAVMLHVGDYKARVVKDEERKSGWYVETYDLLFADGTHWLFNVVSESE